MDAIKELEFIDKIEDNFPFDDYIECVKLIDEAITISPNAVFSVVEEICKKASEKNVSKAALINFLKQIDSKFNHPLRKLILETAQLIILKEKISIDETIKNIEVLKAYPMQYAALSILCFYITDVDGKLEKNWKNITAEWNNGENLFEEDEL
jgi:hypothetical protein